MKHGTLVPAGETLGHGRKPEQRHCALYKCVTYNTENLSELLNVIRQVNGEGRNGKHVQFPHVHACSNPQPLLRTLLCVCCPLWEQLNIVVKIPGFAVTQTYL